MKKLWLSLALVLLSYPANAALDYGLEAGIRQQSGDVAGLNFSANARTGFQGGVFAHLPLQGGVAHFRSGLFYTQRPLESESDITGEKIQYNLDYIDIPIDILFKPHEQFGVYLGFIAAINIADSCSGNPNCRVLDIDTPSFPMVFGGIFKITPKFGANFYFDGVNGSVARGLGNYKAVGFNLMYSMD
ncbi:outer membrane beta-barrel protein [Bdellovibrio bacteriovorus]|uniref:outer membrane beta-barrel protein n=1 Tax=Bdellovibrio bacteriovorus TaxID=959 RepID=UPI0035A5B3D5